MHLEVYIRPDPIRIAHNHGGEPLSSESEVEAVVRIKRLKNETFICTCYADVERWSDKNNSRIWRHDGAHWYCLYIGKPNSELMYWEMPRGLFILHDRLWKVIDLYAAFFEDIP